MVVSEIGEQWSPKTLPANVADNDTTINSGAIELQIGTMIGIKIPKVPQAVPMAKDKKAATRNTTAGINAGGIELDATRFLTKSPVINKSWHTPLMVQARINTIKAGTMDFTPFVTPSIKS